MSVPYIRPRRGSKEDPLRIGILISGGGSGLSALIKYQLSNPSSHKTELIISNNATAKGLKFGADFDIPAIAIELPEINDKSKRRIKHEELIHDKLIQSRIELVVLSGYMRILSPKFVKKWKGRLINIHPSLLPKYKGLNTHIKAIKNKDKFAGCTVHYVTEKLDSGKVILQKKIEISAKDNPDSLAKKVLKQEHKLYPAAIMKIFN